VSTLVVFLTNGRSECLAEAVYSRSMKVAVPGEADFLIVDDSGDPKYREWLSAHFTYRKWWVGYNAQGYDAAMREIWWLAADYDYVFLIEDDFVFNQEVDLGDMIEILRTHPHMAQLVLLRQAWFGNEVQAGGLIPALQAMGHRFEHFGDAGCLHGSPSWLEHRATWSTNPTLFRGREWVLDHPWPVGEGSEYRFGQSLFQTEPETVCAYWGDGSVYVTHQGERKGFGY